MKKKIVLKKKVAPEPVWVGADNAGKGPNYEYEQMNAKLDGADAWMVKFAFQSMYGEGVDTSHKPEWMLRLALLYGATLIGYNRCGKRMTDTEMRRYQIYRSLDVEAAVKESDIHKYMPCNLTSKGGSSMAKLRKQDKNGKDKRVTAGSVLIPLLSRATAPDDGELITEVRKATGSIKFDEKQLAWYKTQFRQGELKGQDGKKREIVQKEVAKKAKAPKPSKKVVIKKAKKEAVAA